MIIFLGLEIMPFKIAKVVVPVFLFACEKGHEKLVPEMIPDILFVRAAAADRKKGIRDPEFFGGYIPADQRGVDYASAPVAPDIDDQVPDPVPVKRAEGIPEKFF